MSGAPDHGVVGDCAFPGPYHGRPSCNAIRILSNPAPSMMPPAHNYVITRSRAELLGERRDGLCHRWHRATRIGLLEPCSDACASELITFINYVINQTFAIVIT